MRSLERLEHRRSSAPTLLEQGLGVPTLSVKKRQSAVRAEGAPAIAELESSRPNFPKSEVTREMLQKAISKKFVSSTLDDAALRIIVDACRVCHVEKDKVVIKEGDKVAMQDPGMYILESGRLIAYKEESGCPFPGQHVQAYGVEGDVFGELALLYNAPRAATVIAERPSMLWSIDRGSFLAAKRESAERFNDTCLEILQKIDILSSLSKVNLAKVADSLRVETYREEEVIIEQGDKGEDLFLLLEGRAVAERNGDVVKRYADKSFFGELALINDAPRAARVYATTWCRCATLDRAGFLRLIGNIEDMQRYADREYVEQAEGRLSQRGHQSQRRSSSGARASPSFMRQDRRGDLQQESCGVQRQDSDEETEILVAGAWTEKRTVDYGRKISVEARVDANSDLLYQHCQRTARDKKSIVKNEQDTEILVDGTWQRMSVAGTKTAYPNSRRELQTSQRSQRTSQQCEHIEVDPGCCAVPQTSQRSHRESQQRECIEVDSGYCKEPQTGHGSRRASQQREDVEAGPERCEALGAGSRDSDTDLDGVWNLRNSGLSKLASDAPPGDAYPSSRREFQTSQRNRRASARSDESQESSQDEEVAAGCVAPKTQKRVSTPFVKREAHLDSETELLTKGEWSRKSEVQDKVRLSQGQCIPQDQETEILANGSWEAKKDFDLERSGKLAASRGSVRSEDEDVVPACTHRGQQSRHMSQSSGKGDPRTAAMESTRKPHRSSMDSRNDSTSKMEREAVPEDPPTEIMTKEEWSKKQQAREFSAKQRQDVNEEEMHRNSEDEPRRRHEEEKRKKRIDGASITIGESKKRVEKSEEEKRTVREVGNSAILRQSVPEDGDSVLIEDRSWRPSGDGRCLRNEHGSQGRRR